MPYSNFTLEGVETQFSLSEIITPLFTAVTPVTPSQWLIDSLEVSRLVIPKSEKARSELIISPILVEILKRNDYQFSLFSGENLNVDATLNLVGECDFILSKVPKSFSIKAPIFALVEAKQNIIENSLGQCVAQMVGAKIYNERKGQPLETIFGCVTNGDEWLFLKLENNLIQIRNERVYINELPKLLGILQEIVSTFLE
jgi:hypothetical protein